MLNPLRSEGEAFRFVIYVLAACALAAVIALIIRAL
jgi:hypothetical protein